MGEELDSDSEEAEDPKKGVVSKNVTSVEIK